MKSIDPTMMESVGAMPKSAGSTLVASFMLILYITPITISANPANCKLEVQKLVKS